MTSTVVANWVSDDAERRATTAFDQLASDVTSALELGVRNQNDLLVAAAAFGADHPDANNAEIRWWLNSVRARTRYPHLLGLAFIRVVRHEDLPAYVARIESDPEADLPGGSFGVEPTGERPLYCFFQAVGHVDEGVAIPPANLDVCADPSVLDEIELPGLGEGSMYQTGIDESGRRTPLLITAPVFETGFDPRTPRARAEAYVGHMAVQVDVEALLDAAVGDHEDLSATLRFADDVSDVAFTGGSRDDHAHRRVVDLMPGWTLTMAGDVDVVDDRTATTILVSGAVASILLAALVWVLGTSRARALALVDDATSELRHRALHDPLTGLANRSLLLDRLGALLARSRRDGTTPAVLYVDLDGFKAANDTHGHGVGDEVLRATADRLDGALRGVDTIARLGGDEFVVLVDGAESGDAPEVVADRILAVLREPFDVAPDGAHVSLTASVGIATGDRRDPEALLRDADAALYAAKALGRDRWCAHGMANGVVETVDA